MSNRFDAPQFGPTDSDGFQTFSLYTPGGGEEFVRVSINLERVRGSLLQTASDLEQYSPEELERLKVAAAITAARDTSPVHDSEAALATIIGLTPDYMTKTLEKYFPLFASLAIAAAMNVCVKRVLNITVQTLGAPHIYGENEVSSLLGDFTAAAKPFVKIVLGRPAETDRRLQDTWEALTRLAKKGARQDEQICTQQQVAHELDVDPSTVTGWLKSCGLTWDEWLNAAQLRASLSWGNP